MAGLALWSPCRATKRDQTYRFGGVNIKADINGDVTRGLSIFDGEIGGLGGGWHGNVALLSRVLRVIWVRLLVMGG